MTMKFQAAALAVLLVSSPAIAQGYPEGFETGPVFTEFGPHTPVSGARSFTPDAEFRVALDVSDKADEGTRNRKFESAARFINMHVANGVDPANIRIAVVVHGGAVLDLLTDEALAARKAKGEGEGESESAGEVVHNANADMVREMLDHGVRFIVCGQSAVAQGVTREDLIPGVEMALSAMTAHALLQQRGYTLNPF